MARATVYDNYGMILFEVEGDNINYNIDDDGFLTVKNEISINVVAQQGWNRITLTSGESNAKDSSAGNSESGTARETSTDTTIIYPV